MSEMAYRRQLQSFTHPDPNIESFARMLLESQLPIPEQLRIVLHLDDIEMQRHAATIAGRLEIEALTPILIQLHQTTQDPDLQWMTVEALGCLQDAQAELFLLSVLQSQQETSIRMSAAYAFHGRQRPHTTTALLAIAQDTAEDPDLRGMVIEALAYQGDKSLLPQILPFLQDTEAVVRWDAVYTVGSLGDASFASYVEPLLNDTTRVNNLQTVADEAREVLEKWGVFLNS
jgi:HEAT repeat protein